VRHIHVTREEGWTAITQQSNGHIPDASRSIAGRCTGPSVRSADRCALGGFVAGGLAGAAMENAIAPCRCDDAGLKGVMIGAPAGAVAAGVIAFRLTGTTYRLAVLCSAK